jgi:hypothetical protein
MGNITPTDPWPENHGQDWVPYRGAVAHGIPYNVAPEQYNQEILDTEDQGTVVVTPAPKEPDPVPVPVIIVDKPSPQQVTRWTTSRLTLPAARQVRLLSARPNRVSMKLKNISTTWLYVAPDVPVTEWDSYILAQYDELSLESTEDVWGCCFSGDGEVLILTEYVVDI